MRNISNALVLALAVIAAIVATGLMAGLKMYAFIVAYWLILTTKNIVDLMQSKGGRMNETD